MLTEAVDRHLKLAEETKELTPDQLNAQRVVSELDKVELLISNDVKSAVKHGPEKFTRVAGKQLEERFSEASAELASKNPKLFWDLKMAGNNELYKYLQEHQESEGKESGNGKTEV